MSKHTPGKWFHSGDKIFTRHPDGSEDQVCRLEDDDDAKLIAAAPEMFEVLKSAVEFLSGPTPIYSGSDLEDMIRAAVKKAEGA